MSDAKQTSGRCLCGSVRFVLHGPQRDVVVRHCGECRRWHGGAGAYTSVERDLLEMVSEQGLRFVRSPESVTQAERGFCAECGSSLFWRARDGNSISVAAGTLEGETGIRTRGHIYDAERADWEHLDDLPRVPGSSGL